MRSPLTECFWVVKVNTTKLSQGTLRAVMGSKREPWQNETSCKQKGWDLPVLVQNLPERMMKKHPKTIMSKMA